MSDQFFPEHTCGRCGRACDCCTIDAALCPGCTNCFDVVQGFAGRSDEPTSRVVAHVGPTPASGNLLTLPTGDERG